MDIEDFKTRRDDIKGQRAELKIELEKLIEGRLHEICPYKKNDALTIKLKRKYNNYVNSKHSHKYGKGTIHSVIVQHVRLTPSGASYAISCRDTLGSWLRLSSNAFTTV